MADPRPERLGAGECITRFRQEAWTLEPWAIHFTVAGSGRAVVLEADESELASDPVLTKIDWETMVIEADAAALKQPRWRSAGISWTESR